MSPQPQPHPLVLTVSRRINAPRDLVYRAWTEPEQFTQWFAPHAATMPFCTLDVRPGGTLRFQHHFAADNLDTWVGGTFLDVIPNERLVMQVHFTDADGTPLDRPGFPTSMQVAAQFADADEGGTLVTMQMDGLEIDQGESVGMRENLERLDSLLTTTSTHATAAAS